MNKVIKDGKVAVLYSPGFGAGFYTWNGYRDGDYDPLSLVFDPILVELVEVKNQYDSGTKEFNDMVDRIVKRAEELVPNGYFGGADDLVVAWVPQGAQFTINEYDGSESLQVVENYDWIVA